jgi:hypothetical protein
MTMKDEFRTGVASRIAGQTRVYDGFDWRCDIDVLLRFTPASEGKIDVVFTFLSNDIYAEAVPPSQLDMLLRFPPHVPGRFQLLYKLKGQPMITRPPAIVGQTPLAPRARIMNRQRPRDRTLPTFEPPR